MLGRLHLYAVAFDRGLRHVIERSVPFDAHASAALSEAGVVIASYFASCADPSPKCRRRVTESLSYGGINSA